MQFFQQNELGKIKKIMILIKVGLSLGYGFFRNSNGFFKGLSTGFKTITGTKILFELRKQNRLRMFTDFF